MTTTSPRVIKTSVQTQVALHLMINQLSVSTMPTALRKRSMILNEIPVEMYVNTDAHKLAAILGTLLNTVISQTNDSCIRVSAKSFGDIMLVHIKDNHALGGQSFRTNLGEAQQMAEKIGGTVTVNNYRPGTTTIAISFINLPVAA